MAPLTRSQRKKLVSDSSTPTAPSVRPLSRRGRKAFTKATSKATASSPSFPGTTPEMSSEVPISSEVPASPQQSWVNETDQEREMMELDLNGGPPSTRFGFMPGRDFSPIFTPMTELQDERNYVKLSWWKNADKFVYQERVNYLIHYFHGVQKKCIPPHVAIHRFCNMYVETTIFPNLYVIDSRTKVAYRNTTAVPRLSLSERQELYQKLRSQSHLSLAPMADPPISITEEDPFDYDSFRERLFEPTKASDKKVEFQPSHERKTSNGTLLG